MADEIKDITKVTEKEGIAVTGVASVFTEKERSALAAYMGVTLSDDVDYCIDELDRQHDDIMERFPYEFDPVTAEPKETALIFESIIDKFQDVLIPDAF